MSAGNLCPTLRSRRVRRIGRNTHLPNQQQWVTQYRRTDTSAFDAYRNRRPVQQRTPRLRECANVRKRWLPPAPTAISAGARSSERRTQNRTCGDVGPHSAPRVPCLSNATVASRRQPRSVGQRPSPTRHQPPIIRMPTHYAIVHRFIIISALTARQGPRAARPARPRSPCSPPGCHAGTSTLRPTSHDPSEPSDRAGSPLTAPPACCRCAAGCASAAAELHCLTCLVPTRGASTSRTVSLPARRTPTECCRDRGK